MHAQTRCSGLEAAGAVGSGLDDTNRRMKTNEVSKTVDRNAVLLIPPTARLTHTGIHCKVLGVGDGEWSLPFLLLLKSLLIQNVYIMMITSIYTYVYH